MRWNLKENEMQEQKNLFELWEMIDNFMMWFNATASIF